MRYSGMAVHTEEWLLARTHNPLVHGSSPCGPTNKTPVNHKFAGVFNFCQYLNISALDVTVTANIGTIKVTKYDNSAPDPGCPQMADPDPALPVESSEVKRQESERSSHPA